MWTRVSPCLHPRPVRGGGEGGGDGGEKRRHEPSRERARFGLRDEVERGKGVTSELRSRDVAAQVEIKSNS